MSFSPVPRYIFRDLTDISPDFLKRLGIRFLMLDLDNTIAAYGEHSPGLGVELWVAEMKKNGFELFIVSNCNRKGRVESFSEALDIGFVKRARKPLPASVLQSMDAKGFSAGESALVGDQIYTDALAANMAKAVSLIVQPRRLDNPFLTLRYWLEVPFRALCRNKQWAATKSW